MSEEVKVSEAISEIKNASEEELKAIIEQWYEKTRTDGLKIGAKMISAATYGIIKNHLIKAQKPSLRDYKRCVDEILKLISVQLSNETEENELVEEHTDDGTAE